MRGAFILACVLLAGCQRPAQTIQQADPTQKYTPDAQAADARSAAIQRDAEAIRAECRRAAGGDWDAWQRQTAPYRAALRSRVDALKPYPPDHSIVPDGRWEALEGRNGFPLFEIRAGAYLNHLYDEATFERFRRERAVVAAHRWLRQRGIDLIFVPVPKMTEVYVEHFLDSCPPDGVIAPHVRRTLLQLLEADVEVVDGLRLFRPERSPNPEYLYNTADPHWAPRAQRIMAKELANRIARYEFGKFARGGEPAFKTAPGPYYLDGSIGGIGSPGAWRSLNPRQVEIAKKAQTMTQTCVTMPNGDEPADDPNSPACLIGHSFTNHFREQLMQALNLSIRMRVGAGATTEAFGDFLRDPELLDRVKVVVWITTEQHLTNFKPLPGSVMEALGSN